MQDSGETRRENANACLSRHCERSEAIQSRAHHPGLLRGACHRAALRADPVARNDAGKPPVRFGGRGQRKPTPIITPDFDPRALVLRKSFAIGGYLPRSAAQRIISPAPTASPQCPLAISPAQRECRPRVRLRCFRRHRRRTRYVRPARRSPLRHGRRPQHRVCESAGIPASHRRSGQGNAWFG